MDLSTAAKLVVGKTRIITLLLDDSSLKDEDWYDTDAHTKVGAEKLVSVTQQIGRQKSSDHDKLLI
jgi:hypothetical protein